MKELLMGMFVFLLAAGLSAIPCGFPSADETSEKQAAASRPARRECKGPDPDGKALWDFLKTRDYARTFSLWPGKKRFRKGTEPHGALLSTYVNRPALEAIRARKGSMPCGAIVLKENYTPERKLEALTVMYKAEGYNPPAGDWFWAKYAPDGTILMEGKAEMCLYCHVKVKDNDYIHTGRLR